MQAGLALTPARSRSEKRHSALFAGAGNGRSTSALEALQPLGASFNRRLRLGQTEAAVVLALSQQRERQRQSGGTTPCCLRLDELEACTGTARANIKRAISRVNPKLEAHGFTIAWLQSSLGPLGYALFALGEVWAWEESVLPRTHSSARGW